MRKDDKRNSIITKCKLEWWPIMLVIFKDFCITCTYKYTKNRDTKHTHLPETLALAAMLALFAPDAENQPFQDGTISARHHYLIWCYTFHIWDVDVFALLDCQALFLSKSQDQARRLPPPSFILLLGSPPTCLSWFMVIKPTDLQDPNGFATSCFTDDVHYSLSDDYAWSVFYPESFTKMQTVLQELEEGIPGRESAWKPCSGRSGKG